MDEEKKLRIIFETVGINYCWIKENRNENLLGVNVRLAARDLLIIFFMVEELFEIKISKKAIIEGKFVTFEQIFGQIQKCRK